MNPDHDVIIIGAGPSGAVAAGLLRKQGWSPLVLERAQFPRFAIGESLVPQCMVFIEEAGMLDALHAEAPACGFQYKNGAAFDWGEWHESIDFRDKFSAGPGETYQVRRADFDRILADQAEAAGADIRYRHEITEVDFDGEWPRVTARRLEDDVEQTWSSRFVLDASGNGRVLPRLLDLDRPSDFPVRQAVFTHVADHIEDPGFDRDKVLITVHPEHDDVWLWLIPFGNGRSSLGVVAEPELLERLPGELVDKLQHLVGEAPQLARHLARAEYDVPVWSVSGYSRDVSSLWGPGYALLGNAGEFLDPVFSSGVTVAMKSASLAAAALDRQLRGEVVDWQADYADPLQRGVDTFRVYVEAWYAGELQNVIFKQDKPDEIKRQIAAVLAGYAWDESNPYVASARRRLKVLSRVSGREIGRAVE